ncbi:MAG: hypothetical protein ACTSSF_07750 [Candidatus Heimdallarchaeaceae archaeon]
MHENKEKGIHGFLSNIFYYMFIVLIVLILVIAKILEDIGLVFSILFISLLVISLIIILYFAIQMIKYNIGVNKNIQIGVFFVVVGFLLILLSISKQITIKTNVIATFLGETFFAYWGIGLIIGGVFIELTLIDQFVWNSIIKVFKSLLKSFVSFLRWFSKQWKKIILYCLDIGSFGGIIYIASTWEILWWKLTIFSVCCIYPFVHHYHGVWRVLKFIGVNIVYATLKKVIKLIKSFFLTIWVKINAFFLFIQEYWKRIGWEILRLIITGGGIYCIYFGFSHGVPKFSYLIYIGAMIILLAEAILRKVVLQKLYEMGKEFIHFLRDILIYSYKAFRLLWKNTIIIIRFIIKHWFKVLLYLLDFVALGAILYCAFTFRYVWWYIFILIASSLYIPIHHYQTVWKISKIFAIDLVYNSIVKVTRVIKNIFLEIWGFIRSIPQYFKYVLKKAWRFFKNIPQFIKKILKTIWFSIRTFVIYVNTNFIRLALLLIMLFSFVYGTALLLTSINISFDFLGVFSDKVTVPIMMFIGAGLIIMATVALILLNGELKKLQKGTSKTLIKNIQEIWRK